MKKNLLKIILLFAVILFSSNYIYAATSAPDLSIYPSGSIGLLTVSEGLNNTEIGGTASLSLVVKPGSGRIFIDSFPLSKIDTQITMRFATELACDLLDKDCSNYDFFYTITASSAIVGGPSAGAAATVLTVAILDNQILDNDTVMTGTINSGNLIGPVSGIPAKTLAAQKAGYTQVLIPKWDVVNNTPYENLTINVISVSRLEDALYYFIGKNYSVNDGSYYKLSDSKLLADYNTIMIGVTRDLCTKYGAVSDGVIVLPDLKLFGVNVTNSSSDNFILARDAINNKSYYSAASFCFSGNVKVTNSILKNLSDTEIKKIYATLITNVSNFKKTQDLRYDSLSTISELETYMIVSERLSESQKLLSEIDGNNISVYLLAYAIERFDTAVIWSKFYELSGQKFVMDKELLRIVCTKKLAEAEERLNYLETYYLKDDIRDELRDAYAYYNSGEYASCIFKSSIVKADANIVLSAIFIPENDLDLLFAEKVSAAKDVISRQAKSDVFPILGYSYLEYANVLHTNEPYSSLLYAEYSLELSNIDMYFREREPLSLSIEKYAFSSILVPAFFLGLFIGILLTLTLFLIFYRPKNKINIKSRKK